MDLKELRQYLPQNIPALLREDALRGWTEAFMNRTKSGQSLTVWSPDPFGAILFSNRELLARHSTMMAPHQRLFWEAVWKVWFGVDEKRGGPRKLFLILQWSKQKQRTAVITHASYNPRIYKVELE